MPPCGLTTLVLLAVAVVVALAVAILDNIQLRQREQAKVILQVKMLETEITGNESGSQPELIRGPIRFNVPWILPTAWVANLKLEWSKVKLKSN
jgi:hypothetical protein